MDHPTTETLAFHIEGLLEPLLHLSTLPLKPPRSLLPLQINKERVISIRNQYQISKQLLDVCRIDDVMKGYATKINSEHW
jgi:hypothetical protein